MVEFNNFYWFVMWLKIPRTRAVYIPTRYAIAGVLFRSRFGYSKEETLFVSLPWPFRPRSPFS